MVSGREGRLATWSRMTVRQLSYLLEAQAGHVRKPSTEEDAKEACKVEETRLARDGAALADHSERTFELTQGGLIGLPAKAQFGTSLSDEVAAFGEQLFALGGAMFCGPGGDRFVYELRARFNLYCKFTPLEPLPELRAAGSVRPEIAAATDIIAVRENMGGIYQGVWDQEGEPGGRVASHRFVYHEADVRRIMGVALDLAATRRGKVHVVLKPGGIPSISSLWRSCAEDIAPSAAS